MRQRGSILIGVLWCMVLLSVLVIGVLHTARMDLIVVKNYGDRVQAHYLALAGVERAKAVLYQDLVARQGSGKNHDGKVFNDSKDFKHVRLGRGQYRVFHRAPQDEGGQIVFGVSDEESRLNINIATATQFTNLTGMTQDMVGAIMTWRSGAVPSPNNASTSSDLPSGANSEYYMSLHPPYLARNGPFQTVRELLMVRGITRELLLGNDDNQNEFLDDDDDPADQGTPAPIPSPGWETLFTVAGTEKDVNASGKDRVNAQNADAATLQTVPGITPVIANAIISYRGQNQLKTLDDLLSVAPSSPNQANQGNNNGQNNNTGNNGSAVISQDLFERVADDFTLASGDLNGMININTAPLDVLICLPGVDQRLAQAIINYRKSSGYFDNVAGLLKISGMTRDIFKQLVPMITVRSETFRITAEGKINSSGVRQRVQEIVHIGRKDIETLAYREDL